MKNKLLYTLGIPFTLVGMSLWIMGLPFILIAKFFGHKYWQI